MAYVYRINFDIDREQMTQLEIGSSVERVLGYLRTLLPSERGFIGTRAMHSLDQEGPIHLVFESTWDAWDDLEAHRESSLAEDKVLTEFEPHVELRDLSSRVYEEVD
jgi:hypothetical protein